jgi:cell division septation protein DedD
MKSLAEKLGTDPEKLYTGLKVALDDGTELSVSALKDAYRPAAELEKARGELLEEMTSNKREVTQNRQELGALVQYLAQQGQLTEPVAREVQKMVDAERAAEADKLLKRIPEWKDPIARAADWSDMRRVAKEQGYTDAEIKLAEAGLADHRTIATWRALAKGPKPAAPPKPAAKVAAKPAAGSRTPAQQFGQLKAAVKTGRVSPFSAVAQLIGEK